MTRSLDLDMIGPLRGALDRNEVQVHYQPEIDLASGAVVGMEALVRWVHPEKGLLYPRDFLPVAEAAGLLGGIASWVLAQCAAERAEWQALPSVPTVGLRQLWVNVAAVQLAEPGFVDFVGDLVVRHALPAGALGLEFSEGTISTVGEHAPSLLKALREAGCALAVDDFGTWYSSLASLDELPVDAVKLDRRFVRGVGIDIEDDGIVASVVRLAHTRHLCVVAEGVESWSEGARLCELGCDRAHGFLFSGPQRAERARWMLARGTGWKSTAFSAPGTAPGVASSGMPSHGDGLS